jgi:hypothetical protein
MLSVKFYYCYAERHYSECHYAQCHYPECHYPECNNAKCPNAMKHLFTLIKRNSDGWV